MKRQTAVLAMLALLCGRVELIHVLNNIDSKGLEVLRSPKYAEKLIENQANLQLESSASVQKSSFLKSVT